MSADELVADGEAIGRLRPEGTPRAVNRSIEYRFTFEIQPHKLAEGDAPCDPATGKGAGTIVKLDETAGVLVLRRSASGRPPRALIPPRPITTTVQKRALERLGAAMQAGDGRYRALQDIVARARPRFTEGIGEAVQATDLAEQRRRAAALDASYLVIQGPPGTGKTWTGARLVVDLIRRGRRGGGRGGGACVVLPPRAGGGGGGGGGGSHKAIHNLLDQIEEAADIERVSFRGLKKSSAGIGETEYASASIRSIAEREEFLTAATGAQLLAGTVWLFARGELDGTLDTLVIDEAGQVALADALAMG